MKNYMMVNGKKIEISQDTADNLEETFAPKPPKNKKQLFIDKWVGTQISTYHEKVQFKKDGCNDVLLIRLPGANLHWTTDAWKLAMQILKDAKNQNINAYPQHYSMNDVDAIRFIVLRIG